ncbi:vacuole effluxer Atg22 like-domain-containing protein [Lactarius pseudohatsudake]|nr:vacuole effluxer Atg22 like-domain-containing protein [Lactarius pseudohatsudake]
MPGRNERGLIVPEGTRYRPHLQLFLPELWLSGNHLTLPPTMSSHILEATPVSELALPEVRKDGSASNHSQLDESFGVTICFNLGITLLLDSLPGTGYRCWACVLPWGSGTKEIMALVFATIGPAADYRTFGRWLILVSTAICWAAQFASMTLTSSLRREIVTSFFAAIFPQLARNTPHSRELRVRHERGELSLEAYEKEKSIEKSKISSVGMVHRILGSVWYLVVYLPTASARGQSFRKEGSYLTAGWRQIFVALKQYKKLPNTFVYLLSFLSPLGPYQSTTTRWRTKGMTSTVILHTYLTLVRVVTCGASVVASWYIQRHWKLDIKMMVSQFLGVLGVQRYVWTSVGPNYAISQTMMCELSPPGFEYMFFGLFGLFSRSASVVGPNVIQAIINKNGNNWKAFPLLAVLIALACIVAVFWIDVPKGRSAAVAVGHGAAKYERLRGVFGWEG